MTVRVQLPPILRQVVRGERWLEAEGETIGAVVAHIAAAHPGLGLHLLDEHGAIRHNIAFLHDGEMVPARHATTRAVRDGDEVVLTNALAGG